MKYSVFIFDNFALCKWAEFGCCYDDEKKKDVLQTHFPLYKLDKIDLLSPNQDDVVHVDCFFLIFFLFS